MRACACGIPRETYRTTGWNPSWAIIINAGALDAKLLSEPAQQALVQRVEAAWPGTVLACAMACFPVGVLRSVLGVAWYDL